MSCGGQRGEGREGEGGGAGESERRGTAQRASGEGPHKASRGGAREAREAGWVLGAARMIRPLLPRPGPAQPSPAQLPPRLPWW